MTKYTDQEKKFFIELLEKSSEEWTTLYVVKNLEKVTDALTIVEKSEYEILADIGIRNNIIWRCKSCDSLNDIDDPCCKKYSDGTCEECSNDRYMYCNVCAGTGEGRTEDTNCYYCRGKGTVRCTECDD